MKQKEISIGAGIRWNVASGSNTNSYFPEDQPHPVPRKIRRALANTDPHALLAELNPRSISNGTGTAAVHEVRSNPDVVVKLSREPFSHLAANALLEKVWAINPRYNTPHYMGFMDTPGFSATIMSRVRGQQIAEAQPQLSAEELADLKGRIMASGHVALEGYGLPANILSWDLTTRNIFHHPPSGSISPDNPLTIIDQIPSLHLDAEAWQMHYGGMSPRDPRDVGIALGDQDAFNRFFAEK